MTVKHITSFQNGSTSWMTPALLRGKWWRKNPFCRQQTNKNTERYPGNKEKVLFYGQKSADS